MIETATWTPGPAVVLIVRESGQQSWLTLEEAIDQRDKLDAAIRSAGQANPPTDNTGSLKLLSELHATILGSYRLVYGGTDLCERVTEHLGLRAKKEKSWINSLSRGGRGLTCT